MPQMSPMNWIILTTLLIMNFLSINSFFQTFKMNNNYKTKKNICMNTMNWSW